MIFDTKFNLTAGVYNHFYNIRNSYVPQDYLQKKRTKYMFHYFMKSTTVRRVLF